MHTQTHACPVLYLWERGSLYHLLWFNYRCWWIWLLHAVSSILSLIGQKAEVLRQPLTCSNNSCLSGAWGYIWLVVCDHRGLNGRWKAEYISIGYVAPSLRKQSLKDSGAVFDPRCCITGNLHKAHFFFYTFSSSESTYKGLELVLT